MNQRMQDLNDSIKDLEICINEAKLEAERNIAPLRDELARVKEDKRKYASKGDFDSVQACIRKQNNLKFKIDAQWNRYLNLKNELVKLNQQKDELQYQIQLEKDKIKRNNEILAKMDEALENYRKTQNLRQAAIDSKTDPGHVEQWFEWGKNDFNETYSYFYTKIIETDDYFRDLQAQKLKRQMDDVIAAFEKTNSLKEASRMAGVSYDTVEYWYEWGSRGFGSENTYFFKRIDSI